MGTRWGVYASITSLWHAQNCISLPPHLQCSLFLSSLQTAKRGKCKDHYAKHRCKKMQGPLNKGTWFTATFFCDDYGLEILFEARVNDGTEHCDHYKLLLESVQNNHRKVCGFFMDANDWTARLSTVWKNLLELGINDKYTISDTTKEGLQFQSVQQKFSGFQRISPAYICYGSPDVTTECEDSICLPSLMILIHS